MITAQVIHDLQSSDVTYISGSLQAVATRVLPPEVAQSGALVFVTKADQLEAALKAEATVIVAHKNLTLPTDAGSTLFSTPSVQLAMAAILPLFDGKMIRFNQETKIHPTALIHPSAHIGQNTSVGPYAVIGEHVKIGDGSTIGAHTVIEAYAEVGHHTILHPQVFLGAHCSIGSHGEIHPHTTIGADGFSFVPNKHREYQKIPQIGRVVIGDRVEIGANCAFDRAALTETRIGHGTKFDNFCHIAHNCIVGNDNVFAAGFKMAGSAKIGSNCMAGGEASVADHITICDGVILAGRAGVTSDITTPGAYGGYPIEPLKDSLKTLTNMKYVTRIRKDVARVIKHLGLKED